MTDPVGTLWAMLGGWESGFHEFRLGDEVIHVPVEQEARFRRLIESPTRVTLAAVPRRQRRSLAFGSSGALWARVESGASLQLLERFRPRPTLVLRDGDTVRHTAFWALSRPLRAPLYDNLREANRRLAGAMKAPKKHAEPGFAFAPMGQLAGRSRVRVVRLSGELHDPAHVAGRLRPSPAPWSFAA